MAVVVQLNRDSRISLLDSSPHLAQPHFAPYRLCHSPSTNTTVTIFSAHTAPSELFLLASAELCHSFESLTIHSAMPIFDDQVHTLCAPPARTNLDEDEAETPIDLPMPVRSDAASEQLRASTLEFFSRRRDQLLKEHPQFLTESIASEHDGTSTTSRSRQSASCCSSLSPQTRIDLLVVVACCTVISLLLWFQYNVSVVDWAFDALKYALQPNIQTVTTPSLQHDVIHSALLPSGLETMSDSARQSIQHAFDL